jgi:DNA-binding XRE family transcriptional regulator
MQTIVSQLKPVAIWRLKRNDPRVSDVSASAAQYFGRKLAHYRARAGITQEELGHLSSIHRTEIGLLENGHRQPRLDTIIKIAGALEVDPCELIKGLRWTPPSTKPGEFSST